MMTKTLPVLTLSPLFPPSTIPLTVISTCASCLASIEDALIDYTSVVHPVTAQAVISTNLSAISIQLIDYSLTDVMIRPSKY